MAKLKYLINRSFSTSKSAIFFNSKNSLKWPVPDGWVKMSRTERISYALDEFDPDSPEIAYYKGIGLLDMSPELHGKSIAAFNLALQLTDGRFWSASIQLAEIYAKENNFNMAWQVLLDAVRTLHNSIKSEGYSPEDIRALMLFNKNQPKYQKKSLPHGLANEHSEEKIWLYCWRASYYLAQVGDLKGAYSTLLQGKDHLESALSNNEFDFEYLKNLLLYPEDTKETSLLMKHT